MLSSTVCSGDDDVHCRNISATQSVNATMDPPHKRAETRGATLHLIRASQQSVAGVQSRRARHTPRLVDAKPQSERQTDTHTDRQTDSSKYPLQYYYSRLLWSEVRGGETREGFKRTYLRDTEKCALTAAQTFR